MSSPCQLLFVLLSPHYKYRSNQLSSGTVQLCFNLKEFCSIRRIQALPRNPLMIHIQMIYKHSDDIHSDVIHSNVESSHSLGSLIEDWLQIAIIIIL